MKKKKQSTRTIKIDARTDQRPTFLGGGLTIELYNVVTIPNNFVIGIGEHRYASRITVVEASQTVPQPFTDLIFNR